MNQPKPITIIIIFALFGIFFLVFVSIFSKKGSESPPSPGIPKKFKVISVSPKNGAVDVALFSPVIVEFDREILSKYVKFSTEPSFDFKIEQPSADKKKIKYKPTVELKMNTTYYVNIDAGEPFSSEFRTKGDIVGANPNSADEFARQEKEYQEKYAQEDIAINALRKKSPIVTENFKIEFSYDTGDFVVTILKGNLETQKPQVLKYFEDNGVKNLDRISIKWQP